MLSSQRRRRALQESGHTLYRVAWEGQCERHDGASCRCTLVVTLPHVQSIVLRVPRVDGGRVLTLEEQYLRVVQMCVRYDVFKKEEGDFFARLIPDDGLATKMSSMVFFQYFGQSSHNRLIRAPFRVNNMPKQFDVRWDPRLRPVMDLMDEIYLKAYGRTLPKVPLSDDEFAKGMNPSKTRQWYNKHLFSRHVYGRFYGLSPIVHTMQDVSPTKMADLFAEFSQNDTESREHFDEVKRLIPRAMALLEKMLGVQHQYKSIAFRYRPEMLKEFVSNMQSSAGIRPGQSYSEDYEGVKVNYTTTGKKFHQFPAYAADFHTMMQDIWAAEEIYDRYKGDRDNYCIVRMKNEFKAKWLPDIPEDELEETLQKLIKAAREFFIPNLCQQFLSKILMAPKQYFERGDVIRIGQKWKFGEAQRFANRFHAFSKRHKWFTGDVRKLDKNIRDWMLSLYIMSGRKYFKEEDEKTSGFLDRMFVLLAERINVKLTCHITGLWTLMKGVMYSGGFETSHGDSWILGLIFCMYFIRVIEENPHMGSDIVCATFSGDMMIALYGDDHLMVVPDPLVAFVNETDFAAFALKFFGMVIRELEEYSDFFSTVDPAGELTKKGVVFLKRYFVLMPPKEEGFPVVYPFKPTHETILKLVCNKENDARVYPLQAIGQAYDTLGTNPVAYAMVKKFYEYWMGILDFDQEAINSLVAALDPQSRNRLWKKCGMNWRSSTMCFPTLSHLQSMHRIDLKQGSNVIPRCVVESMYGVQPTPSEADLAGVYFGDLDD